jgi:hypothetical protein
MRRRRTAATAGRATVSPLWSLAAVLTLVLVSPATAQPGPDPATAVASVESAYEALDYAQAEALARAALARPEVFTRGQLVRLHTTLALLLYARNDALGAAQQFRAALSLDPTLALDPVLVSPVTLSFFEEVKGTYLDEQAGGDRPEPPVRYVVVRDSRPGAALRSLVLPGWGQRARGQRLRGWLLTAAWGATVGGGIAAHVQRDRARDAYLEETDPDLVEDRYRTYNNWHRLRGGLLAGAAVVWAGAVIDALATGAPEAPAQARVSVAPAGAGLRLSVGF